MIWTDEAIEQAVDEAESSTPNWMETIDAKIIAKRIRDDFTLPYPEPDWSQAPDWAQWWVVEPWTDNATWYEQEPELLYGEWEMGRAFLDAGPVDLPLGCDWRLCKAKRPENTQ